MRIDPAHAGALLLEEVEIPQPGPGEVTIDVRYAGVNLKDVKQRGGSPTASRGGVDSPGFEVSGHVRDVGPGVDSVSVGDPVIARPGAGGYADVAVARAGLVAKLPSDADDDTLRVAAATFIAASTASLLIEELGRLRCGESILVHGAAGAVGSALGQLSAHLGISPIIGTVGSEWKREFAAAQGYSHVLDRDSFAAEVRRITHDRGVDAVADPIGGAVRRESYEALAPLGRLLAFGRTGTDDEAVLDGQVLRTRNLSFQGMSFGSLSVDAPEVSRRVIVRAVALQVEGAVRVPVHATYGLDAAAAALDELGSRRTTGKVLLRV